MEKTSEWYSVPSRTRLHTVRYSQPGLTFGGIVHLTVLLVESAGEGETIVGAERMDHHRTSDVTHLQEVNQNVGVQLPKSMLLMYIFANLKTWYKIRGTI